MALPPKRMPNKQLRTPQPNAGVTAAYERLLRQMIRQLGQDYLSEVMAAYRQVRLGHIGDGRPDQPRDSRGRWIGAGAYHEHLQQKYSALLDRLEQEDANPPPYGKTSWAMGPRGYDTRQEGYLSRPVVLGEIPHPSAPSVRVPVVFSEGRQKTSKPNGKGHGRRHIEFMHGRQIRNLGFRDALDFARHITVHHDVDQASPQHHSRNLSVFKNEAEELREALHLMDHGDHYRVTTAYPLVEFQKKR